MLLNRVMMTPPLWLSCLGWVVWLAIAYWGRTSPPMDAQQRAAAQQDKQTMIDDLERGQVLYIKVARTISK